MHACLIHLEEFIYTMKSSLNIEEISFDITSLQAAYADGSYTPVDVVDEVYRRIAARGEDFVWTVLVDKEKALENAREKRKQQFDTIQKLQCLNIAKSFLSSNFKKSMQILADKNHWRNTF